MKKIKTVLSLALAVMVMALTSCGNKAGNPAEEFAAYLDKIAGQVKSYNSETDFEKIQPEMEAADKIVTDNADYELTDNDRQAIKDALGNFYRTTMSKSFELANQQVSEGQLDMMVNMITSSIDNIKTLGELNNTANANANGNSEFIESVEIGDNDSLQFEEAVKLN